MIERQEIDGRPATVAYLKADMTPVDDPDDVELLRIVFDDGNTLWLIRSGNGVTGDAEWKEAEHPRGQPGNAGQFGPGGGGGGEPEGKKRAPESPSVGGEPKEAPRGRPVEPAPYARRTKAAPLAALPEPFTRRPGSAGRPSRLRPDGAAINAVYQPGDELRGALQAIGAPALTYHELGPGGAAAFHKAISDSKAADPNGAAVHAYTPEEYAGMKLFTTPDAKAGFALKGDDIISVFRAPDGPHRASPSMLALAVKEGGRRLDAFDTVLPEIYGDNGFKAVARVAFDPAQFEGELPPSFKAFNNGKPDVVFMTYDPNHAAAYEPTDGEPITDYDQGEVAQRRALANTGLPGSKGDPNLISSRKPSAAGYVEGDYYRRADLDSMRQDPALFHKNMDLLRNSTFYPNLRLPPDASDEDIASAAKDHAKSNLRFLFDHAPPEVRRQAHRWYEGAQEMAAADATTFGLPLQSVVGVYASQSPQKLWDMNVYSAHRMMEIYRTQQQTEWTPKMTEAMQGKIDKAVTPRAADRIRREAAAITGKRLNQLTDPVEKAKWIIAYDEAVNPEGQFQRLSPDGKPLGTYVNFDGTPTRAVWQTALLAANGIKAIESGGNRDVLSNAMGSMHKVRSFYNNILDPKSANNDVTMDTHAIGAALLRALGGTDPAVAHSLAVTIPPDKQPEGWKGASTSDLTGLSGTYALWADAYRELAAELDIQPRVLQSVTWEIKRRMFGDDTPEADKQAVEQTWRDYHDGTPVALAEGETPKPLTLEQTQQRVFDLAGGAEGKRQAGVADPAAVAARLERERRRAARGAVS